MEKEEIKKLIDGNPHTLIKKGEELGLDFSKLDRDIARSLVRKRFNLTDEQFDAVDFIFWVAYWVEKEAEDIIIEIEKDKGARVQAMESIVSKLHFGDKITIIEELYAGKKDPFVGMMRKIQNFRNDIAHGRFDNLKYAGYYLNDSRGRVILLGEIRDILLQK